MRILLIDDDPCYREAFAEHLAEAGLSGATLDQADNAADGARIMNRGEHDIYFVDYRLPGSKGTDLIKAARSAGIDRPIFCLTGLEDPRLDLEAEQAGASFHLAKDSLTAGALSRTIRFALRNAAAPSMPRDAEDRFRLAQEAANIGTWDWDVASGTITWDARMFQLYGVSPRGTDGEFDVLSRAPQPDACAAISRMVRLGLESGGPLQTDVEITWEDGSVHSVRAAGRVIRDADGSVARISGISWDITEIRQLVAELAQARDAAQQASRAKSRFLAGMTHELRTPLNGILGNARLLRGEGGLSPAQAARVDRMLSAGAHLLELIHCVLDLSEIETERVALKPEPIDPRVLATACLDMVRNLAEEKRIALHLTVAADVPRLILADPVRLRQILLNLLGNATKFTPAGSVALRLRTTSDGTCLRFEVADTGAGIPADKRPFLFQDFGRLRTNANAEVEGAGLGLALSIRLATLMGGRLDHADNPGGGSVFFLDMPLVEAEAPATLNAGAPAEGPGHPGRSEAECKLNVLVVDDSEMNLDIAASFIRLFGHSVTCATDGAAAVAAAATTLFDVILMDVQMPGIDGLEATRRIRALPGPHGRVPVVALTAQVFTEQLEACRQAGMTGHLAKPFTETDLFAIFAETVPGAPPDRRIGHKSGWAAADADLPVIDLQVFTTNTRLLRPASVISYLENIKTNAGAMLATMRMQQTSDQTTDDVLKAVHKLAGNIGLFGFVRAADIAGRFERAARTGAPGRRDLAAEFVAALVATLEETESRLLAARAA